MSRGSTHTPPARTSGHAKQESSPQPLRSARPGCRQLLCRDLATAFHPQRVTLHIRYFLSKSSNATAAPAPGRSCSRRSRGSTLKILGRTPVTLTKVHFLPGLPKELDSNPPRASGEAGWIQPQTCSNHTLAAACQAPGGLLPPSRAGAYTKTKLIQLKIFNTCCTRRITFYTKQDTSLKENTVQNPYGSPKPLYNKDQELPSLTNRLKDLPSERL